MISKDLCCGLNGQKGKPDLFRYLYSSRNSLLSLSKSLCKFSCKFIEICHLRFPGFFWLFQLTEKQKQQHICGNFARNAYCESTCKHFSYNYSNNLPFNPKPKLNSCPCNQRPPLELFWVVLLPKWVLILKFYSNTKNSTIKTTSGTAPVDSLVGWSQWWILNKKIQIIWDLWKLLSIMEWS